MTSTPRILYIMIRHHHLIFPSTLPSKWLLLKVCPQHNPVTPFWNLLLKTLCYQAGVWLYKLSDFHRYRNCCNIGRTNCKAHYYSKHCSTGRHDPSLLSHFQFWMILKYLCFLQEASEWQTVFYISSAIYLVGAIIYGVFASGERQSWAKDKPQNSERVKSEHCYSNSAVELDSLWQIHMSQWGKAALFLDTFCKLLNSIY